MRYTKQIYWTIVCCSLFLFLQHGYKYHFYYLEQLQLFLFSGRYASDTILQPGGLSLYVSRFLVQFQLLPFAGALIHALLLTATGILTQKFLKQTAPEPATYLISLLPTGMLLLLHLDANYKLQGTVAFLLMLIALLLYTRISSPVRRSILGTILTLLLYYIAGPVASLFAGMAILQDFLHKKPKPALSLIYLPAFLIPGLITLFSGGEGTCRMIFLPLAYYDPLLRSITIYFAWIALPVCLLLAYFLRKTAETSFSKKQLIVLFAQLIPLYFFFIWILHKDNRAFLENMQQDYYLRTEQWDKIISEFPGENKSNMQTMNVLNLALAQKGALGDRLFDYKQLGHKTLLDSWDSATPSAIALCDIYYHIGDIAAAQKLAFEGMVASINDGNVRLLKRLIETNLIFGEYPVAGKYIALLEQTLLYRKEASEYRRFLENDEAVEKDAILGGKRKGLINGKQYAVSNFTPKTLEMLAVNNPANQLPMQYLLAICLTNKDLKHFRTLLEKYLRTDVLPALSKSHQEAVIAMEQHNPGFWIKNGVSTKTEQQFRAFDFDMGSPQVPNFKEKMESSHGDTYWYYVLFTNIKAIQSNETVNPYNADYQPRLLQNRGGGGKTPHDEPVTSIFPDYTDVTIPVNIAPLNFSVAPAQKAVAAFRHKDISFQVSSNRNGEFIIPPAKWQKLLAAAKGDRIEVAVTTQKDGNLFQSFRIHVAHEPIDPYIAYRLIEPGYALWNKMGIYQRNLESYRESAVYENRMTGYNCVNCHSFCAQNPNKMLFHLRARHGGTVLIDGDEIDFLQTQTDRTISALVYPSWHPSGRFVAFSVNKTTQDFHPTQRTEVFDLASDVVVYDIEAQTILTTPPIFSQSDFETFPSFSADGKTLYFCSGAACPMPDSIQSLRYSLCSISFDPETKSFGRQVDTLYNAETQGLSVSFPRVSPNGKYLMCTLSSYATFPIWHKDADLYLIDLEKGESICLDQVNSEYADSYHSWSSDSRWVVFSSRRLDGLYTRPFFVYINENGEAAKPFLLPQKKIAGYYTELMKSYNIPEFITGKIKNRAYPIMKKAKDERTHKQVDFQMTHN